LSSGDDDGAEDKAHATNVKKQAVISAATNMAPERASFCINVLLSG